MMSRAVEKAAPNRTIELLNYLSSSSALAWRVLGPWPSPTQVSWPFFLRWVGQGESKYRSVSVVSPVYRTKFMFNQNFCRNWHDWEETFYPTKHCNHSTTPSTKWYLNFEDDKFSKQTFIKIFEWPSSKRRRGVQCTDLARSRSRYNLDPLPLRSESIRGEIFWLCSPRWHGSSKIRGIDLSFDESERIFVQNEYFRFINRDDESSKKEIMVIDQKIGMNKFYQRVQFQNMPFGHQKIDFKKFWWQLYVPK